MVSSEELPALSSEQVAQLDSPVSLTELKDALAPMPKSKSPGLDGIPPDLLLPLWDLIGTTVNSINSS